MDWLKSLAEFFVGLIGDAFKGMLVILSLAFLAACLYFISGYVDSVTFAGILVSLAVLSVGGMLFDALLECRRQLRLMRDQFDRYARASIEIEAIKYECSQASELVNKERGDVARRIRAVDANPFL